MRAFRPVDSPRGTLQCPQQCFALCAFFSFFPVRSSSSVLSLFLPSYARLGCLVWLRSVHLKIVLPSRNSLSRALTDLRALINLVSDCCFTACVKQVAPVRYNSSKSTTTTVPLLYYRYTAITHSHRFVLDCMCVCFAPWTPLLSVRRSSHSVFVAVCLGRQVICGAVSLHHGASLPVHSESSIYLPLFLALY